MVVTTIYLCFKCHIFSRRKPGPIEGETFCSRSGFLEIETELLNFQDPDWQSEGFEDFHTGRGEYQINNHLTVNV